jgi:hypothetical protein
MTQPTGTEARVCEDIARRQVMGIAKYGQTVADNPLELRQWLQHAYEEALDLAIYLKRAIEETDKTFVPDVNSSSSYLAAQRILTKKLTSDEHPPQSRPTCTVCNDSPEHCSKSLQCPYM